AREKGDFAAAAAAYRKAIELTARADPARPERLVLLALALTRQKTSDAARECVQLGLREMDSAARTSVATDLIESADGCADQLPEGDALAKQVHEKSLAW